MTRETVKEHAQWPQRVPPTRLFDRIVELRHDSVKLTLRKDGLSRLVLNGKLGVGLALFLGLRSGFDPPDLERPGRLPHQQGLSNKK